MQRHKQTRARQQRGITPYYQHRATRERIVQTPLNLAGQPPIVKGRVVESGDLAPVVPLPEVASKAPEVASKAPEVASKAPEVASKASEVASKASEGGQTHPSKPSHPSNPSNPTL